MVHKILDLYGRLPYHRGKWRMANFLGSFYKGSIVKTVSRHGIMWELDLEDIIQRSIYFNVYEVNEVRVLKSILKSGDTFFDIGANIGFYSLTAAKAVCGCANIYSFEPVPQTFKHFCKHIALNGAENIKPFDIALTDKDGEGYMCETKPDNLGWSHLAGEEEENSINVKTMKLDTFVEENDIKGIDVIKVDIEGNELRFLIGAEQTLTRYKPKLMMEINPPALKRNKTNPGEVFSFLDKHNYKIYNISGGKPVPFENVVDRDSMCNILAVYE